MKLLIVLALIAFASAVPNLKTVGHEELIDVLLARFTTDDFSLDKQVAEDELKEAVVRSLMDKNYQDPTPDGRFSEDITSNAVTDAKVFLSGKTTDIPSTSKTTGSISVDWNQLNASGNREDIRVKAKFDTAILVQNQTVNSGIELSARIRIRQEDGGFEIEGDQARRRIIVESFSGRVQSLSTTDYNKINKREVVSRAFVLVHDAGDKNGRIATVFSNVRASQRNSITVKEEQRTIRADTHGSLITVIRRA